MVPVDNELFARFRIFPDVNRVRELLVPICIRHRIRYPGLVAAQLVLEALRVDLQVLKATRWDGLWLASGRRWRRLRRLAE